MEIPVLRKGIGILLLESKYRRGNQEFREKLWLFVDFCVTLQPKRNFKTRES
jgi:hypothetical protein